MNRMKRIYLEITLSILLLLACVIPIGLAFKKNEEKFLKLKELAPVEENVEFYVFEDPKNEIYFLSLAQINDVQKRNEYDSKNYEQLSGDRLTDLAYNEKYNKLCKKSQDPECTTPINTLKVSTKNIKVANKKCLVEILVNNKPTISSDEFTCIQKNHIFLKSKQYYYDPETPKKIKNLLFWMLMFS